MKPCKVNLPRINIYEKVKEKLNFCPACKNKVENIEQHYSVSLICKQVECLKESSDDSV